MSRPVRTKESLARRSRQQVMSEVDQAENGQVDMRTRNRTRPRTGQIASEKRQQGRNPTEFLGDCGRTRPLRGPKVRAKRYPALDERDKAGQRSRQLQVMCPIN